MANVLQRSLNTGVAPVRILRRHPSHEAPNLSDERRHLSQNAAAKSLSQYREPPSAAMCTVARWCIAAIWSNGCTTPRLTSQNTPHSSTKPCRADIDC
jgi:hypothetical protein